MNQLEIAVAIGFIIFGALGCSYLLVLHLRLRRNMRLLEEQRARIRQNQLEMSRNMNQFYAEIREFMDSEVKGEVDEDALVELKSTAARFVKDMANPATRDSVSDRYIRESNAGIQTAANEVLSTLVKKAEGGPAN